LCRNSGTRVPKTVCSTLQLMEQVDKSNSPEHRDLKAVVDFSCTFRHGIGGYAWTCPVLIKGQTWLNTGIVGFNRTRNCGHSLRQTLMEFLAARYISVDKSRFEGHPIRWFHPSSIFSAQRVLLVGDAAGIDPLWGEGISFSLGYGCVAANSILHAFEHNDFSFTGYKEQLFEHEVGRELMNRLDLANNLYRSRRTENVKDHLLSVLSPKQN